MKLKNKILNGIILALVLALQSSFPALAVKVQVGGVEGIELDSDVHVVSKIDCVPLNGGDSAESVMNYRAVGDNTGVRQTAKLAYAQVEGDSLLTEAWCHAEEERIIAELTTANVAMYSGFGERSLVDFAEVTSNTSPDEEEQGCENAILTWISCRDSDGIGQLLSLVINIMTAGVVILLIVGIVVSGIQWLTARDNEGQIVKAKSRLFNIVLGAAVWGLMWLILNWLLPGGLQL